MCRSQDSPTKALNCKHSQTRDIAINFVAACIVVKGGAEWCGGLRLGCLL
jgi:hypothetical protein